MNPNRRLIGKELAAVLGRCPAYVSLMRRAGFPMVGGMATAAEAFAWLESTGFNCTHGRRCPGRRAVNSINSAVFRGV